MCTQCHETLGDPRQQAAHARHAAGPEVPSCVDCHMPQARVRRARCASRSHRIELPAPARAAEAERPDACTLCHVDKTRAWAVRAHQRLWGSAKSEAAGASEDDGFSEVEQRLLAGDPIERALAADALGRPCEGEAQRRRVALLLDVMEHDPYPAIRHFAQRSARRLLGDDPALASFVPETPQAQRAGHLKALRARFPLSPEHTAQSQTLRAQSRALAIEIGE